MEMKPRDSSPSIYLTLPQGGEKTRKTEDGVEPRHREIEFLSRNLRGKKLASELSYIYFIYTQHKL